VSLIAYTSSSTERIQAAWTKAGCKAGVILGGAYGAVIMATHSGYPPAPVIAGAFGLIGGVLIGALIGTVIGFINGTAFSFLVRPLALRPWSRLARARAAAAGAAVTALPALLLLASGVPLIALLPPVIPSMLTAAFAATRIPPAGRAADDPETLIQIKTH
jgi:hypothetical protein